MENKTNDEWAALVMKQVDDIYRLETELAVAQARINELTIVTGDQHMRLDAVLKVQAGLVTTLQEIRAQFDDGGPMQKFIDAKLTAAGVTL